MSITNEQTAEAAPSTAAPQTTAGPDNSNEGATTTGSLLTELPSAGSEGDGSEDQSATADEQQTDSSTEGAGEQQATEGESESSKDAEGDDASADEGAPETYADFEMPEGVALGKETIGAFTKAAKEANLSQSQAQSLLQQVGPAIAADQQKQHIETVRGWVKEVVDDPDIGGDKLNTSVALAEKAFNAAASPELKELVRALGIGNHPDFIKSWKWVGEHLSEDTFVAGSAPGARTHLKGSVMASPKRVAKTFYGDKK